MIEITDEEFDNEAFQKVVKQMRQLGYKPFENGYYHCYLNEKQYQSLIDDKSIVTVSTDHRERIAMNPAIYGAIIWKHNQSGPGRIYGALRDINDSK